MQIHKHLITVMFFILLFVYALAGNSLYQSKQLYARKAELTTQNLAQSIALNVGGVINKLDIGLYSLSNEVTRQISKGGIDEKLLQTFIKEHKEKIKEFAVMWVTDEKGNIKLGIPTPPNNPPTSIADRDYFQRLKNDPSLKLAISKPTIGRVTKTWSIIFAQRINMPDGSFAGIAMGSLKSIDYFSTIFSGIDVGKDGKIEIRDENASLISMYPLPKNIDEIIGKINITTKSSSMVYTSPIMGTYLNVSSLDNKERLISYKKVLPYPLIIATSLSTDEIYRPWKKEVFYTILILTLFTLIELTLARFLYLRAKELVISKEVEQRKHELELEILSRKKKEEELIQNRTLLEAMVKERTAKLEASNEELESFSYSVSHDLRSPLRGIDGWSLALQEDYGSVLDEQGQNYLNRVRAETKRMEVLIDDLLKLSKISRTKITFKEINLSAIAETVTNRLKEENSNREIHFVIEPNMMTIGDEHFIEIALTNLFNNACKFTSKKEMAQIEFSQTIQNGEKVYFVRDNGVGFNMNTADKLFGVFQRMHRQTEYPGTGIGLATVKRIITIHSGKIWAESSVNNGATFFFTLNASLKT